MRLLGTMLAVLLLASGCDDDPLSGRERRPEHRGRLVLDLSALRPAGAATAATCRSALERVEVTVRQEGRDEGLFEADVPPGAASVALDVATEGTGETLFTVTLVSNTDAVLYRGSATRVLDAEDDGFELAVTPRSVAPVPVVCPDAVVLGGADDAATAWVLNRGTGPLAFTAASPETCGDGPCVTLDGTQGTVTAGDSAAVTVVRGTDAAAAATLVVTADEGVVTVPVTLAARGARYDVALAWTSFVEEDRARFDDDAPVELVVTNAGPSPAPAVVVAQPPEPGFALQDAVADGGTFDAETGQWAVGPLAAGASATLSLVGRMTEAVAVDGTVTLTAALASALPDDTVPANDAAALTLTRANWAPELLEPLSDVALVPGDSLVRGLDGFFGDRDPDQDGLRYAATSSNPDVAETVLRRTDDLVVFAGAVGTAEVEVEASDGVDAVPFTFLVTVQPPDRDLFVVPDPQFDPPRAYCRLDDNGGVTVVVGAAGTAPITDDFVVAVDFPDVAFDAAAPMKPFPLGETNTIRFQAPEACFAQCRFVITVDRDGEIAETDEDNNVVVALCE